MCVYSDAEGEPSSKKIKMDVSLDGGMEKLAKANVTEVGSTSPVEDFITIISRKDEDTFEEACVQMQKRICQIALDSFGDLLYEKALDCVRCLREQCIKKKKAKLHNTFVKEFKDTLIAKARRDFFDKMCNAGLCLIGKSECMDGASTDEVNHFTAGEESQKKEESEDEEDSEDLLGEL